MKNSTFPILFASDSGYAPHLGVAIYSLLENNKFLNIRIIVFTAFLSQEDRGNLQKICDSYNTGLEFVQLDDHWFDGLVLNYHFKKSNYYRLFAADLTGDDKCLYLDADIVVTGSIFDIVNTELNNSYLAAVEDYGFSRHQELEMKIDSKYFNSGVMLLNLIKWRSDGVKNRVISLVKRRPEVIYFVDQCGLNSVVDGNWVLLEKKFNFQNFMLLIPNASNPVIDELPVIIHFTGSDKPWLMNNKHPYKLLYWDYRNKTHYKSFFPDDLSLKNVLRYILPMRVKFFFKRFFLGTLK